MHQVLHFCSLRGERGALKNLQREGRRAASHGTKYNSYHTSGDGKVIEKFGGVPNISQPHKGDSKIVNFLNGPWSCMALLDETLMRG